MVLVGIGRASVLVGGKRQITQERIWEAIRSEVSWFYSKEMLSEVVVMDHNMLRIIYLPPGKSLSNGLYQHLHLGKGLP